MFNLFHVIWPSAGPKVLFNCAFSVHLRVQATLVSVANKPSRKCRHVESKMERAKKRERGGMEGQLSRSYRTGMHVCAGVCVCVWVWMW